MRSVITFFATWLFVLGFVGFFAISALLGYARDTESIVETARAAEVRTAAVDLTTELVAQELARDALLKQVPKVQIAAIVGNVIGPTWFDTTLRETHGGLVAAIDNVNGNGNAIVDLTPTKRNLRAAFSDLKQRARRECETLIGAAGCRDQAEAMRVMTAYERRAKAAIARLPDEVDILAGLERAIRASQTAAGVTAEFAPTLDARTLQAWLGDVHRLRWLGLGLLVACLALIAMMNSRSWGLIFWSSGRALALASGTYLALTQFFLWGGPRWLLPYLETLRTRAEITARTDQIFATAAERLILELAARALDRATDVVILCFVGGIVFWFAGLIVKRRYRD